MVLLSSHVCWARMVWKCVCGPASSPVTEQGMLKDWALLSWKKDLGTRDCMANSWIHDGAMTHKLSPSEVPGFSNQVWGRGYSSKVWKHVFIMQLQKKVLICSLYSVSSRLPEDMRENNQPWEPTLQYWNNGVTAVTGVSAPNVLPELQWCQPLHSWSEEVDGLFAQRKLQLLK